MGRLTALADADHTDDLRAHCGKLAEHGAPATAIHARDILKQIYGFVIVRGERVANPADEVGPVSIAKFAPRDRALSPTEIPHHAQAA